MSQVPPTAAGAVVAVPHCCHSTSFIITPLAVAIPRHSAAAVIV